jgi:probable phosphoglycerate mutase
VSDEQDQPDEVEYRQTGFRPPPGSTEIFLVRHGASEPSRPGRLFPLADGHGDPALAPEGLEQAERVGERFADEAIDAIYVTTLRRTAQTAAPLAARLGLEPIVEPGLREVGLGEWEGGIFREKVAKLDPIAVRMFTEERWDVIPGAEAHDEFMGRVRDAIERIAGAHPGQRVVAVAHGGVIGAALTHAVRSDRGFAFAGADNGSVSHLVVADGRWILRRFNDTSHLHRGFDLPPLDTAPTSGFSA